MAGIDKIFAPLAGRPLVAHCIAVFNACPAFASIVLVVAAERLAEAEAALAPLAFDKLAAVCAGGERRQDSVYAGLERLGHVDVVAVHDGARPLVTAEILESGIEAVRETGAAVAAVPVVDTLKQADPAGIVLRTVPRERLWAVQTPQLFDYELLLAAHRRSSQDVTDDAMLIEAQGGRIKLFPGSPRNLKVTTPDDLLLAEALLRAG
jgi:2-C-methyl-D-erythritol 4-phosphate cytidylyltransferase